MQRHSNLNDFKDGGKVAAEAAAQEQRAYEGKTASIKNVPVCAAFNVLRSDSPATCVKDH